MADASAEVALQRGLGIAAEDRARLPHARPGAARASTGPRHRCRGSSSRRRTCRRQPPGLQRGLGIAAEDRKRAFVAVGSLGVASTGPRHRCRGSPVQPVVTAPPVSASTGPRHRCRGSHPAFAVHGPRLPASTGPRHRCRGSLSTWSRRAWRALCFNGASASLPRIASADNSRVATSSGLQRGLGIAAEDRSLLDAFPKAMGVLQRGLGIAAEDRLFRELGRRVSESASTGPRHRCRGSTPSAPWCRRWPRCFNGASASLPRIAAANGGYRMRVTKLQRGLGIAAEDRLGVVDLVGHGRGASTGPRHRCRGSGPTGCWATSSAPCFNGASASLPRIELHQ